MQKLRQGAEVQLIAVCVADARDHKQNHTGGLSQGRWVRPPEAPPFFEPCAVLKGLLTVMAQIVSFIRRDHYWSSDHKGVPSIRLLHCCNSAHDLSHQKL